MTMPATATGEGTPEHEMLVDERPKETRADRAGRRSFTVAVVALLIIAAAYGLFELFQGPVSRAWYDRRQGQLIAGWVAAVPQDGPGSAVALLQIPRLRMSLIVAEGVSSEQLRSGPGHYEKTPLPGDVGNSVIFGHREVWGAPFEALATLEPGDPIVVQVRTPDGLEQNGFFKVESVKRAGANDRVPFARSSDRRVTLVTGAGGKYSSDRLVVTAISGEAGTLEGVAGDIDPTPDTPSLWNAETALAFAALAGAALLWLVLRRRYHVSAVLAVVIPVALLGAVGVMLNVDALLPVVR